MNFMLLLVSNLLATMVASDARVEVQANGALNIASQGTLNVGSSDSEIAAKFEKEDTMTQDHLMEIERRSFSNLDTKG